MAAPEGETLKTPEKAEEAGFPPGLQPLVAPDTRLETPPPAPPAPAKFATLPPMVAEPAVMKPSAVPARPPAARWQSKDAGEWPPAPLAGKLGEAFEDFAYKDHYALAASALGDCTVLGATRRGKMHAHAGTHREDAMAIAVGPDYAILCVSDGAGAYSHSRVGSEITVRTICRVLKGWITRTGNDLPEVATAGTVQAVGTAMASAVRVAIQKIHEAAALAEAQPKEFRCTLLLAVAYGGLLVTSKVGDGFIATRGKDGQVRRLGLNQSGVHAGEVSAFLPDAEALTHSDPVCTVPLAEVEAVFLATDGVEDAYFPFEENATVLVDQLYRGVGTSLPGFENQPLTGPILGDPQQCEKLAAWLAFEKRGENDDRTLLTLFRPRPLPPAAP